MLPGRGLARNEEGCPGCTAVGLRWSGNTCSTSSARSTRSYPGPMQMREHFIRASQRNLLRRETHANGGRPIVNVVKFREMLQSLRLSDERDDRARSHNGYR